MQGGTLLRVWESIDNINYNRIISSIQPYKCTLNNCTKCYWYGKYAYIYKNNTMATKEFNTKNARFDTRLSEEQKVLFERAARLGGYRNLTDFVVVTVQEKAKEIISERERIIASQKDSDIFFDAVMNPKAPNKELSKAADEFKAFFS